MMCFREGCHHGIDEPGGVELIVGVGTRGSIGSSRARISAKFCSVTCTSIFLVQYPSQSDILRKVGELCEKQTLASS
ncbi:MAG: hypothetical protein Q8Q95_00415 [bacterium]|nr:hypothetical protein [bacterium]